jgi:hypothetical protein
MRLLLCVHGSDENCPSSSFVLLTIAPEYARQMLQRREIVRQIEGWSEELGTLWALSFWDATPRWVGHDQEVEASPEFASALATGTECDDMEDFLRTRLGDELVEQVLSDQKIVELSEDFTLDDRLADGTECDQVLLDMLGARYRTYLRHVDGGQETDIVPWAYFERAIQEA